MEKKEDKTANTVRTWRAKMNCIMPFGDYRKDDVIELSDAQVDARVKALFECLTPEEKERDEKAKKTDPELKVMLERLKAAKVPLKRGMSEEEIRRLFNEFLATSSTKVTGDVK